MEFTTTQAAQIVARCVEVAEQGGHPVGAAVVDAHGDLLVAWRHQSKGGLTARLANAKAHTAAVMKMPTRALDTWQQERPVLLAQMGQLSQMPLIPGDGGLPIVKDGHVLGGLGLSGAKGVEDQICDQVLVELGYDSVALA